MNTTEKAVQLACEMANNSRYGYDQTSRWGPDFDCSSFVITVWEQAGVPVKSGGATYTGNMRGVFLRCGFKDVTGQVNLMTGKGLLPGDVLLNSLYHTALFIGFGKLVQASINELGKTTGGQTGDQTGREIAERSYYNYPWDCVLRYGETPSSKDNGTSRTPSPTAGTTYSVSVPLLKRGSRGESVQALQGILIARGYSCGPSGADAEFGCNTENALKNYQKAAGLDPDGECGGLTWAALLK